MPLTRRELMAGLGGVLASTSAEAASGGEGHFEVTHRELKPHLLDPAHDGLRIAQISDIHVGFGTPDVRIIDAIRAVNEAAPDLVLLTGDFVTHSREPLDHIPVVLSGIRAPAFAVLGNHDHWVDAGAVTQRVTGMGYELLRNQNTRIRVRGADLWLAGVDDGQTHSDDVGSALKGMPSVGTRLVMAHTPPTARKLPDAGLVCFSGHTHGGQIRIPIVTTGLMHLAGQPFIRGLYSLGSNQLYVNRGLGFGRGGMFPRVGSDPEVSVFTLRAA